MEIPVASTRGIMAPARMLRNVALERHEPPPELAGLVDRFWSVRWKLAPGVVHRQDVVSQPGVNLSVGNPPPPGASPPPGPYPLRCVVNGVATNLAVRMLSGAGRNLAAKTTTGGFGAWVDDVAELTDRVVPASEVLGFRQAFAAEVAAAGATDGPRLLGAALVEALEARPPARIAQAREVAGVAAAAERHREIARVDQLAALAGVTPRTLQRTFASYAGVSPTWVIRRFRLIEAAELVRDGRSVAWAEVAAALGYADQSHLITDFRRTIGQTPEAYAREQRSLSRDGGAAPRAAR